MERLTNEFIGHKATFRLKNESSAFTGEIQNVDKNNRRVTFYKVTVHKPGKQPKVFGGLLHYKFEELRDVKVTDEVNQGLINVSTGKPCERHAAHAIHGKKKKGILHDKEGPRHLENLVEFDPTVLYMMNIVEKHMENTKDENGQYKSQLPTACTLLTNHTNQLFSDAINHLMKFSSVGVAFEGVNLGRSGQLSWILVSTRVHTIFFDIKTMGKAAFDAGLRDLFQSSKTMKVIHDCRRPSDILHHRYETKLVNIFDTQVGAVLAFKALNKNIYPRYVTSLADCLRNELKLDEDDIHVSFLREHNPQQDEEVWNLRPAPTIVYEWMHRHSCHLLALRERQMELLMMEFTLGVDIYLKNLREVYKGEAETRMTMQHLLPTEYTGLPMMVKARLREEQPPKRIWGTQDDVVERDQNGWIENWTGFSHPAVVGSRDTIWHMRINAKESGEVTEKKEEKSEPKGGKEVGKSEESPPDSSSDKQEAPGNGPSEQCSTTTTSGPLSEKQHVPNNGSGNHASSLPRNGLSEQCSTTTSGPLSDTQQVPTNGLSEQVSTNGPNEQVVRNGGSEQCSNSTWRLPERPDRRMSSSSASDCAAENNLGAESKPSDTVAALLSRAVEEHREKEKNTKDIHNMVYVFKPAGELIHEISKKKQKEMESSRAVAGDDLTSKKVKNSSVLDPKLEHEFDLIPSQSKLTEMNRLRQTAIGNNFLITPDHETFREDHYKGFSVTTFKEAIPPPPYTVNKETGKSDPQEALAAILPRVQNQSVLLDGSRTSHHLSGINMQQKRKSVTGDENNNSGASPVPCDTRNGVSASGDVLKRNPPLNPTNCASGSSAVVNSIENHSFTSLRSPVTVQNTSHVGQGAQATLNDLYVPCQAATSSQKAAGNQTASTSITSWSSSQSVCSTSKLLQDEGTATAKSFSSAAEPSAASSSAAQASTGAALGRTVCNGAPHSPLRSCATVSISSSNGAVVSGLSSDAGSSSTASSLALSPPTASNSQSQSEIRKAIANGESMMSILGFKKSPQQLMASKFKATQDQKPN